MFRDHLKDAGRLFGILALIMAPLSAQAEGKVSRHELGRADTASETELETIVTELRMSPGAYIPLHSHPGDEHIYVVQGGPLTTKDGKVIVFEDGGYVFFPRGQVHGGLTASGEKGLVLVTVHIIDKGKPVYEFAE